MLAELADELAATGPGEPARARRIVVDVGPGSFTGARIGVAAARALGLAWGAPVRGIESDRLVALPLLAVADRGVCVLVSLEAGRGRLLVRRWTHAGPETGTMALVDPDGAAAMAQGARLIAGAGLDLITGWDGPRHPLDPDAGAVAGLPADWSGLPPSPLYAGGAFGDAATP